MVVGEFIAVLRKTIINMKQWKFLLVILLLAACNNQSENNKPQQNKTSNTLYISVDESFQPIIEEELKVFKSAYPDTKVVAEYKPEAECLRDLEKDSTKIVIISRELNREETKFFDGKVGFKPEFGQLAKDAVTVIVNSENPDSSFTVNELKQLLAGKGNGKLQVAIDGNTATSTVRYLKDSLLAGAAFGKNITGAKNSEDLINYISSTPSAIGFVGISWITNPQSKQQEDAIGKLKMALIECKNCEEGTFARPSQQTITFNQYPLVRGLYYVLKENYAGLGSRFVEFLSTERGQLIFRRALLVPTKMNFGRRRII
ncbi:phosphate ABC transporter substrate-binding protein [Segetibacter aerophilus]|uniref:Phosphate ABC transporter substrate-binding protein n=2 Tax=Segetibacter aerophilus TaxID=670293 RepID=A0A512B6S4_9BACT|nr:phosphate ABC transporter substrate-binding protein [Segetibacter aerophilus]